MPLPIWQELLVGVEMVYLRVSPAYWGFGLPKGDGSAVVVVPAFLGTDFYLTEFRAWLARIGYEPFVSGIGLNAECPNLLVRYCLTEAVNKAYKATRRKVHMVGHSLGGLLARSVAAQMPRKVASVIALGTPVRGLAVHPAILAAADMVRQQIHQRHGGNVMPKCYTAACGCAFLDSCMTTVPKCMRQTAVYSKADGLVDWRYCRTGDPAVDCEVSATHIGMVFNPLVYQLIAQRLAAAQVSRGVRHATGRRRAA